MGAPNQTRECSAPPQAQANPICGAAAKGENLKRHREDTPYDVCENKQPNSAESRRIFILLSRGETRFLRTFPVPPTVRRFIGVPGVRLSASSDTVAHRQRWRCHAARPSALRGLLPARRQKNGCAGRPPLMGMKTKDGISRNSDKMTVFHSLVRARASFDFPLNTKDLR